MPIFLVFSLLVSFGRLSRSQMSPVLELKEAVVKKVWADHGSGSPHDGTVYSISSSDPYVNIFGGYVQGSYESPGTFINWAPEYGPPMVARELSSQSVLAKPIAFDLLWQHKWSESVAIWRARGPEGYVSLGDIATYGSSPSADAQYVVRKDCVVECSSGLQLLWADSSNTVFLLGGLSNDTINGGGFRLMFSNETTVPFSCLATGCLVPSDRPQQVHIGYGLTTDTMRVNWVSSGKGTASGLVQWGSKKDRLLYNASSKIFPFTVDGDSHLFSTHVAEMTRLTPESKYYYRVGCDTKTGYSWSQVYNFKAASRADSPTLPQYHVVYGDLGAAYAYSLCWDCGSGLDCTCSNKTAGTISEIGKADMILHVGDFAYDFDSQGGHVGDVFMQNIEQTAAYIPYMVNVGNHESGQHFAHYTERFRHMPTTTGTVTTDNGKAPNNWYYSFNSGLIHYAQFSTEIYFDYPALVQPQYEWLEKDLSSVDRTKTPWVIVTAHRSIYCSCDGDCDSAATRVREGVNGKFGMEELFFKYGVDIFINGHEHDYERMYDVYQGKTMQTTTNPKATMYIVTGAAGNQEKHEPFIRPQPTRSALRANTYGYSRMWVHNATHIHWQQVQTQKDTKKDMAKYGEVIDDAWFVQTNHGPFTRFVNEWKNIEVGAGDLGISETLDFCTGVHYFSNETLFNSSSSYWVQFRDFISQQDCVTGVCH